jgi:3-oxoacyl-[acyl-carrier protein] reductase
MTDYTLVTGAARNIGRAIATRLKADGQNILMLDVLDPEDPSLGEFRRTDLSSSTDTAQAMAWAMGDDRRITRVVNCAGIVSTDKIEDVSSEDFDRVMAINVRSYVEVMRALTPAMKAQGFGRVVNIASRAALGYSNLTSYAASKAAVVGLTRTWASELARHGITVNAIGPGPIETDMLRAAQSAESFEAYRKTVPVGRFGKPEDIANGVSFFLDDRSSFVTGQVLFICGGMTVGNAGVV